MKVYNDIIQGSPEWHSIRAGKPTASCFDKILTPTGKTSTQANAYANLLIAEFMKGGQVTTWEGNKCTERGNELEPYAAVLYEIQTDTVVEQVAFIENDGAGCSPDRLVGDNGLLEIKCPLAPTHVQYLLDNRMPIKYIPQVQGQLYITGRKWCAWMSYYPDMSPLIVRIKRDEEYIIKLSKALHGFFNTLNEKKQRLIELGYLKQDKND